MKAHLRDFTEEGREGLLFPGRPGHHLTASSFYGRESTFREDQSLQRKGHGWFEARQVAGRPDLRFHDLRHTGLTNAAIATRLTVTEGTVKTHLNRVMTKLRLTSRAQAVVMAYESRLVVPQAVTA